MGLTRIPQLQESGTWYRGGTWRRGSKATPVTQVAKESIFAATDKASELVTTARNPITQGIVGPKRSPSTYLCRSIESPGRLSSLDASTKTNSVETASSRASHATDQPPLSSTAASVPDKDSIVPHKALQGEPAGSTIIVSNSPDTAKSKEPKVDNPRAYNDAPLWRAWFLRREEPSKPEPEPEPEPEPPEAIDERLEYTSARTESPVRRRMSNPELATATLSPTNAPRSWLGLWSYARPVKAQLPDAAAFVTTTSLDRAHSSTSSNTLKIGTDASRSETQLPSTDKPPGWAFWSKDFSRDGIYGVNDRNVSEVPLTGSSSQSHHPGSAVLDKASGIQGKRPRALESPQKVGTPQPQRQKIQKEEPVNPNGKAKSDKHVGSEPSENNGSNNLLLPQRAITIGVHGYFPAPFIRSVLGQPTGTSIRFADGAADAISQWTKAQGYSCDIEKVALEGEGKILERLDVLWKLLLNWADNIRRADFIMVACHSQGVPVAIMLIAKLIEFGCVQGARIGVCAMAGVNLGPFVDYKSRWIGGSARELFEFAQSDSRVSKDYNAALTTILSAGVRVAYIGSIDDQLVSLDSSTFGTIDHPNIYRAVFVDGRVHAPDFLTHLVGFVLKLRNLGVSDHGLIRELSSPLAGSLYSGEGHSRIYEDDAVYYLAVQNTLQVSTVTNTPLKKIREDAPNPQNPYILPFSLRGVLEEDHVRTELQKETMELLQQFDEWKPTAKVLKDVKFRLEGVRSKL
ncbi:MAG: hypothetical protein Q9209_004981 [Squamulea sp. 1 TL-2023]